MDLIVWGWLKGSPFEISDQIRDDFRLICAPQVKNKSLSELSQRPKS